MDIQQAKTLIKECLTRPFEEKNFRRLVINLLNHVDESKALSVQGSYIKDAYKEHIRQYKRLATYTDPDGYKLDVLVVFLTRGDALQRARTMQRNFTTDYLKSRDRKDAALVAYVGEDSSDWRFSFVRVDYKTELTETGRVRVQEELTPSKRYSFLVGQNEPNHTAQQQLYPLLCKDDRDPKLDDIETAFNIESISIEFFERYKELFLFVKEEIDKLAEKNAEVKNELNRCGINTSSFGKKLLGQIVFLYFLQKKGWLGVNQDKDWGTGSRNFLEDLFKKKYVPYGNFFNEIIEPLFYEALAIPRDDNYYPRLNCKIPFLNGGLFEPAGNYDWQKSLIKIKNETFKQIFETFNLYNFTIREDEPLEKEVAVDPEMLGKVFEKLLEVNDRKAKGAFYTPRPIVHYMCEQSLTNYLATALKTEKKIVPDMVVQQADLFKQKSTIQQSLKTDTELDGIPREDIEIFVQFGDFAIDYDAAKEKGTSSYKYLIPESVRQNAVLVDNALAEVKICDPAIGSGAFPVDIMGEIVKLRMVLSTFLPNSTDRTSYDLKRQTIENSIYGVDIDPSAIDIGRLRLWLSLVVDEEDFQNIQPLPNLDYKIICGNSLLSVTKDLLNEKSFHELEELKHNFFKETDSEEKSLIKKEIDQLIGKLTNNSQIFDFRVFFSEVFRVNGGFDIVIGNPPYVSTKGVGETSKQDLEKNFGFADDLYNHFFFRAFEICRENGVVAYITSKTYFTIQTKENLRKLLESKRILEIIDTGMPFEAMVDTAVLISRNLNETEDYPLIFKDGREKLENPDVYKLKISLYRNAARYVIFRPDEKNLRSYEKLNQPVKGLLTRWWKTIETSKNITQNYKMLDAYRDRLHPGEITLIGLLTEGGQGLATANNGRFVGVKDGTKQAESIRQSRPKKLFEVVINRKIRSLGFINTKSDAEIHLAGLSESEIVELFDKLKEKYGRDIFGQGYIFRIIAEKDIADVSELTINERLDGINQFKPHYVPYDKGDKDGNRWYLETPFVLDWSRESVKILQTDPKARWQGYQYFFKKGFCWSDIHTVLVKSRLKENGVYDIKSMSLFTAYNFLPDWFFVFLLNSRFISEYHYNFINNTQTLQINDARQVPVVIPNDDQLQEMKEIFDRAYRIQKKYFAGEISETVAQKQLDGIQKEVDQKVLDLYGFT